MMWPIARWPAARGASSPIFRAATTPSGPCAPPAECRRTSGGRFRRRAGRPFVAPRVAGGEQHLSAPKGTGFLRQRFDQTVQTAGYVPGRDQKPLSSRIRLKRFRHRPRINPIEPRARPSRSATSLYGCGGCSKKSSVSSAGSEGQHLDGVANELLAFQIRHDVADIGESPEILRPASSQSQFAGFSCRFQ